jgi:hypothetical protein
MKRKLEKTRGVLAPKKAGGGPGSSADAFSILSGTSLLDGVQISTWRRFVGESGGIYRKCV